MAKSVDEITNDAIEEGGYLCLLYFDVHASSEEAVKNIMVGFIAKLTKEPGVIYALGEIDKPIVHDNLYSSSAEVKLLANDFATLMRVCLSYSPIGIEILRPHEPKLSLGEVQDALLAISQYSQSFTQHIMEKVLSPADKEQYAKKMQQRMQLGKDLLQKKNKQ